MHISDAQANLYLDVCTEFVVKRHGKNPGLNRTPGKHFMSALMVFTDDDSKVCFFDESDLSWEESGDDFTHWSVVSDGKVFVSYQESMPDDSGMFFQVRHPREVDELLHLLTQPASYFEKAVSGSQVRQLRDLADSYVLIPEGNGWRALSLAHIPQDMPPEFRVALGDNLVQKFESLTADKFSERWPSFVATLPDAASLLRAGYITDKNLNPCHGLSLLTDRLGDGGHSLRVLLVPSQADVSSLYLREYLCGDREAAKHLDSAFFEENGLDKIATTLGNVPVSLPGSTLDQIRIAAQVNLLRQRVLAEAEGFTNSTTPFDNLQASYQTAICTLRKIADANHS